MKKVILWQVKKELTHDKAWRSWNEIYNTFNLDDYDMVYSMDVNDNVTTEELFRKFNLELPNDYKGRSMSVSDIISFPDKDESYYVDIFGMTDISCTMASFFNRNVATKEEQRAEAIKRLEYLGVLPSAIKAFSEGKVWASEYNLGILYETSQMMKEKIKQLEQNGDMVFHVVKGTYYICGEKMEMTSYLLLSNDKEEWKWNHDEIEGGVVYTYTANETIPEFSEHGYICVAPLNGGLTRDGECYDYLEYKGKFQGDHPNFDEVDEQMEIEM